MEKHPYPLSKVYGLLEPGPVVLLTTPGKERPNVMAQSWHTMMEFEPPLVGCIISDRNYSYGLLEASGECVINIPTVELAGTVAGCGNASGAAIDKFVEFGLTAVPASAVGAPLVGECYACLECRVADTQMVERYGLFILEIVKAWIDPGVQEPKTLHHLGNGRFMVAGGRIRLESNAR